MSFEEVKKIAGKVREIFEQIEADESGDKYNRYCMTDLGGYCGRASIQVYLACKRAKIRGIELWDTGRHTFNIYEGKIVDITATQFGRQDKVLVRSMNVIDDPDNYHEYNGAARCPKISDHWAFYAEFSTGGRNTVRSDTKIVRRCMRGERVWLSFGA